MLSAFETIESIKKGKYFGAGLTEFRIYIVDSVILADFALEVLEVEVVGVDAGQTLLSVPVLSDLFVAGLLLLLVE